MTHIFDDFPIARESIENQRGSIAANTGAPMPHTNKEFRHPVVGSLFARRRNARPGDQGKAHRIHALENQQRMRLVTGKPVGKNFIFMGIVRTDDGEQAGI